MGLKIRSICVLVLFGLFISFFGGCICAQNNPNTVDTVLYVNPSNGNDANDGLAPQWNGTSGPKKTIKNSVIASKNKEGNVTIKLAPGMYNENSIFIDRSINFEGSGAETTIIDGKKGSIFDADLPDADYKVVFKDIGIENSYCGITIENEWDHVDIHNCSFINNYNLAKAKGGAAINNNGIVSIDNCNFEVNYSTTIGGAIFNDGKMNIKNSHFHDNRGEAGGAILSYNHSKIEINNSTFEENYSYHGEYGDGGSIFNSGLVDLKNCKFNGNSAISDGGAICNYGSFYVFSCQFESNEGKRGGAIFSDGKYVSIDNNLFSDNYARVYGGAICKTSPGYVGTQNKYENNTPDDVKIIENRLLK